MNHARDTHQSEEEFELRVFQQLSKRTSAPENETFDNVITELNKKDNAITEVNMKSLRIIII